MAINYYQPVASVGDFVSINLLVTRTTVFIAEMSRSITRQCYQYECIFVDHKSYFTYVHLLEYQTGDESVEAKESFEAYEESI